MIQIVDDFLEKDTFLKIKNFSKTVPYTPQHFVKSHKEKEAKEFNHTDTYGLRYVLGNENELLEIYSNKIKETFKLKSLKISPDSGMDKRKLDIFKPHKDEGFKINLLHMIEGPTANTNGTVFYSKTEKDNYDLDIHVGFKENRAVLFPSLHMHSPAVSKDSIWRTTLTIFIEDYER